MRKVKILVSTVDKKIESNISLLSLNLNEQLQMVIINQKINDKNDLVIDNRYCHVINSNTKGLSISRNIGLQACSLGEIVLIADDDVAYPEGFDKRIKKCFKDSNEGILTFQIITPEGDLFKKYKSKSHLHNWKSILSVNSISISLDLKMIESFDLRFDEQFGLGAKYSSGEENIFLNDALGKGVKARYINEPIVIHPRESSGQILTEKKLFDKGALFRRLYDGPGYFLAIVFLIKKFKIIKEQKVSMISAVKNITKGYNSLR